MVDHLFMVFWVIGLIPYIGPCSMCYPVCGMVYIKVPLLLIRKSSLCSGSSGFPVFLSAPLPHVLCYITVNKMC